MVDSRNRSRRALMTGLAGISLGASVGQSAGAETPRRKGAKPLVVFFSRSGNTRVIAGLIKRAVDADLFEIQAATPYPEEYLATVKQATLERDREIEPALAAKVSGLASYDTIYLGFPIWGETVPPVIRSFLSAHDLSGKSVIPFITHGGYGLGNSRSVLAGHAPKAAIKQPFSMQADQERQTMNTVNEWLSSND